MNKITLHPEDTPAKAYERLMRFGAFAMAARVASQYGLQRDLLILALDRALVRFEELGFPELAIAFAKELGFTYVAVTAPQLIQTLAALEAVEKAGNGPLTGTAQRFMN